MPNLLLLAIGLLGLSGLLGLATPRGRRLGDECCAALTVLGGLLGAGCALTILVRGLDVSLSVGWPLPLGRMAFRIDPLAAVFLLPVFVVPALGSVYAAGYWAEADHPRSARRLRVFHGLLAAAMALVVVAQDGVFLLFAWELMALSAFFAVSAEDERPEVRRAAWIYFIATHVGTLALLGLLALLRSASGSFALTPLPATLAAPVATGVFVLALIGFGVKAGLMPLHVWLPGAHANAPSHVSAVLSGVMLKVGLYGLLRTLSLLPTIPAWWGWTLVGVGGGSAFLGIAFSLAQRDYKRQLAYSSIENVGIITLGLGLALLGRATHSPALTAFGLAGALLHVWNHSVFKPLLFFVAGALLQATHTRELDDLGGLAGRMPRTAVVAAIGCLAIAALPPLNGFLSEWLIYRGYLQGVSTGVGAFAAGLALATALLAATGALAVAGFAKLYAVAFLGQARTAAVDRAHDPPSPMLVPMALLAGLCLGVGLFPTLGIRLLLPACAATNLIPAAELAAVDVARPLAAIALITSVLLVTAVAAALWLRRRSRPAPASRPGTWDCGFAAPSPRVQYGQAALVQGLVGLLGWAVLPRRRAVALGERFPAPAAQTLDVPDLVLDRLILPSVGALSRVALHLRLIQQGKIQVYVLYVLVTLIVLLLGA